MLLILEYMSKILIQKVVCFIKQATGKSSYFGGDEGLLL